MRLAAFILLILAVPLAVTAQPAVLPTAFEGEWEGSMVNLGADRSSDPLPVTMTIRLQDDGSYEWTTIYNRDVERGKRAYRLIPVEDSASDFLLDEQNGIVLRARLLGGDLVSTFQVADRTLMSRYHLVHADSLIHEVIFWSNSDKETTTGSGVGGENGQPVDSFHVDGIQRSVFVRTKGD